MLRARLSGKGVEKAPSTRGEEEREVVLPLVDAMGKAAPGALVGKLQHRHMALETITVGLNGIMMVKSHDTLQMMI